jgi:hypothetical protein
MKRKSITSGARTVRNGTRAAAMAAEVPAAAFITIAHRLPMIFAAAVDPKARGNPELTRMVSEKTKAAMSSAAAAGKGAARTSDAVSRYWTAQAQAGARMASGTLPSSPHSALDFFWRQARVNGTAAAELTATLADLATSTAARTLAPAHRKVTANAKRLAAKKATLSRAAKARTKS